MAGQHVKGRRYDWAAIRAEYIASDCSLRDLAAKPDMPVLSVLAKWSRKQDWLGDRDKLRKNITQHVEEAVERKGLAKSRFDFITEQGVDRAAALATARLASLGAIRPDGTLDVTALKAGELFGLLLVLEKAQAVKYRALGIPPPKQVIALEEVKPPADAILADIAKYEERERRYEA